MARDRAARFDQSLVVGSDETDDEVGAYYYEARPTAVFPTRLGVGIDVYVGVPALWSRQSPPNLFFLPIVCRKETHLEEVSSWNPQECNIWFLSDPGNLFCVSCCYLSRNCQQESTRAKWKKSH